MKLSNPMVLICLLTYTLCAGAFADNTEVSAKVKTIKLKPHTLDETIETYGRVVPDPDLQSNIAVVHAGTIAKLMVRPGEQVTAGEALLKLATSPASRMDYQQAQANVQYAKSELARQQSLFQQHLVTRGNVASAEKDLKRANAALQAQKRLGSNRSSTVLRAPFNGVVSKVTISEGDRVQKDTTVMQIARRQGMLVPLGVEQEDVRRLKKGQTVVLEPVFNPDLKIHTVVSRVHVMADPITGLVDVLVTIPADKTDDLIFNEMMRGRITLEQQKTLAVPESAVLSDRKGHYLFIVDANKVAHKVYVKQGIQSKDEMAISGPIQAGDTVVVSGNYELTEGMHVRETQP